MQKLISVIVPVYNVEQYIYSCVYSILNQSYRNLEIILVDDGSTDASGELCDRLAATDRRIKIIHKKNGGLSDARNAGIEVASGDFLTFVDSDDYLQLQCIEHLYNLICEHGADISVLRLYKTYTRDCNDQGGLGRIKRYTKQEAMKEMLYARDFTASACSKLYERRLFEEIRFPYGKLSEDVFTLYDVVNEASKIVFSDEIGYYYYTRPGSIINSKFSKRSLDVLEAMETLKNNISLKDYELVKAYSSQMVECTLTILDQEPNKNEIHEFGIWEQMRRYRRIVVFDKEATKRVRAWALLSYAGKIVLVRTRKAYADYKRSKKK